MGSVPAPLPGLLPPGHGEELGQDGEAAPAWPCKTPNPRLPKLSGIKPRLKSIESSFSQKITFRNFNFFLNICFNGGQ